VGKLYRYVPHTHCEIGGNREFQISKVCVEVPNVSRKYSTDVRACVAV